MWTPHAHDVLSFMAAFLALWGVSLIVRGLFHRSRHGTPLCHACRAAVTVPGLVCQACRYEARSRNEFWPRKTHRPAVLAGIFALLVAAGCLIASILLARMVRQEAWGASMEALSGGLALGVLSLIAWALAGEAPKGRKRCPKCWYEMASLADAGQFQCPECGHDALNTRGLMQRRRRSRLAVALVPALLLALWTPHIVRSLHRGPSALIPTPVMVLGMWVLPERFILGTGQAAFRSGERDSLADRLGGRSGAYRWQHAWISSRIRGKLTNDSDPATLLRAMRLAVLQGEDRATRLAMLQIILETSSSSDPILVRLRAELLPRLSYAFLWSRSQGDAGPLLERHLDEIRRRISPADPEAMAFMHLCLPLGERAETIVPLLSAGITDPAASRAYREVALTVLAHASESTPAAHHTLLGLLIAGEPTLANWVASGGTWTVRTPEAWAEIRSVALELTGVSQVAAISLYGQREPIEPEFAEEILKLATTPGPARVGATGGLCSLIGDSVVEFDRGFPVVRASVEALSASDRLALLEHLHNLNSRIASSEVDRLFERLAKDPDPRVAARAEQFAPKVGR